MGESFRVGESTHSHRPPTRPHDPAAGLGPSRVRGRTLRDLVVAEVARTWSAAKVASPARSAPPTIIGMRRALVDALAQVGEGTRELLPLRGELPADLLGAAPLSGHARSGAPAWSAALPRSPAPARAACPSSPSSREQARITVSRSRTRRRSGAQATSRRRAPAQPRSSRREAHAKKAMIRPRSPAPRPPRATPPSA